MENSYETITSKIDSGFYEKNGANLPEKIEPCVVDEEADWLTKFEPNTFDLIINNMQLHWVNELEKTLRAFNTTLQPDGVFMGTLLGADTL